MQNEQGGAPPQDGTTAGGAASSKAAPLPPPRSSSAYASAPTALRSASRSGQLLVHLSHCERHGKEMQEYYIDLYRYYVQAGAVQIRGRMPRPGSARTVTGRAGWFM